MVDCRRRVSPHERNAAVACDGARRKAELRWRAEERVNEIMARVASRDAAIQTLRAHDHELADSLIEWRAEAEAELAEYIWLYGGDAEAALGALQEDNPELASALTQ